MYDGSYLSPPAGRDQHCRQWLVLRQWLVCPTQAAVVYVNIDGLYLLIASLIA